MITGINSEDRLVQKTIADYLKVTCSLYNFYFCDNFLAFFTGVFMTALRQNFNLI